MRAVYDLEYCPTQWDFSTALAAFEVERVRQGEGGIDLIFAPGSREGFRPNHAWPESTAAREAMMQNLLLPLCGLLPSVRSVTRWKGGREELRGEYGFEMKPFGVPVQLATLASPNGRPFRVSPAPEIERDLVTITLREAEHQKQRNSNLQEWLKAAARLETDGYRVVFVRDTRVADEPLPGFATDPRPSRDVLARADLYWRARLNLFVNQGPLGLALYGNLPFLNFRPLCETHRASSSEYLRECGFEPGRQMPGSPPWQRYVWDVDRADIIVRETIAHMETLEPMAFIT